VGGPAMEELAADGWFCGVIDFTTNEVTDPLVGGIHDGDDHHRNHQGDAPSARRARDAGGPLDA